MTSFLWLAALEGFAALVVLALLPSDVENRVWGLYSAPRLAMMLAALAGALLCAAGARVLPVLRRRRPALLAQAAAFLRSPLAALGLSAAALGLSGVVLAGSLALPVGRTGMLLRRALPLSAWAWVVTLETVGLLRRLGGARLRQAGRWVLDGLEDLSGKAHAGLANSIPPLAVALACAGLLLSILAARSGFPTGYAGLFSLMSEQIAQNGFRLPADVPFYGPGGMPFAYPPLGLYLMALFTTGFHTPVFAYLRYAPTVFSLLAMAPFYGAVRALALRGEGSPSGAGRSPAQANAAAAFGLILLALSPRLFLAQGEAAGITRALGFLFCMTAFYCVVRLLLRPAWTWGLLAALAVALTLLSHLNYLAYLAVLFGALVLALPGLPFRKRAGLAAAAGLGGVLLAAPWWSVLVGRYGAVVFLNAAFSHGNFSTPSWISFFQRMIESLGPLYRNPVLGGGLVLGLGYHLATRRWFFPLAVLGVLALALGDWLVAPFAAALAGEIAVELARLVAARTGRALPVALFAALALAAGCYNGYRQIEQIDPIIGEPAQAAADWLRANTPPDSRYLFFTASADEAEWLPWLARRTPVAGSWGAEWNGDYGPQFDRLNEVSNCAAYGPQSCVADLVQRLSPDVLVVSGRGLNPTVAPAFPGLAGWKPVYESERYTIWERP